MPLEQPLLKVALATGPSTHEGSFPLHRDVQLAKAAILYADEVDLVSPNAEMLAMFLEIARTGQTRLPQIVAGLDEGTLRHLMDGAELPENFADVIGVLTSFEDSDWDALQDLTGADLEDAKRTSKQVRAQFEKAVDALRIQAVSMLEESGGAELATAIEAGLLRIRPVLSSATSADSADITAAYVEELSVLLSDPGVALMLDDQLAELAHAMIHEGVVTPSAVGQRRAAELAVGGGFLVRLPALDVAPMDELLDLRTDLAEPLGHYRRGMANLSGMLAVGPYDAELSAAVDYLFAKEVSPALADLREGMSSHGLLRDVARHLMTDARSLALATVGPVVAAGVANLADMTHLVEALPVVATVGQAALAAHVDRAKDRDRSKRSEFFYLYELDRRMSKN